MVRRYNGASGSHPGGLRRLQRLHGRSRRRRRHRSHWGRGTVARGYPGPPPRPRLRRLLTLPLLHPARLQQQSHPLPRPIRRRSLAAVARLGATTGSPSSWARARRPHSRWRSSWRDSRAHRRGDAHDGPLRRGAPRRPPFDHRDRPPEPQQRSAVQGQVRPHADVWKPQVRDLHRRRRGCTARGVHQGRGHHRLRYGTAGESEVSPCPLPWRSRRGTTATLSTSSDGPPSPGTSSRSRCPGRDPSSPSRTT